MRIAAGSWKDFGESGSKSGLLFFAILKDLLVPRLTYDQISCALMRSWTMIILRSRSMRGLLLTISSGSISIP
jgi:hypothetical protein